jgi:hypothetical protein
MECIKSLYLRLYEIKLGDIHSFPGMEGNIKHSLDSLKEDENFKYEVSLLGKRIEETEDLRHLNTHGYSKLY